MRLFYILENVNLLKHGHQLSTVEAEPTIAKRTYLASKYTNFLKQNNIPDK